MTQTYQTGFKTVLAANIAEADTTATLATPPTVTKGRMLLKNGNIQEWIGFTGVSGSTITGLTRNLSQTADPATGGTGLSWGAGTQIILVAMHDQLPDKLENTAFTGSVTATDISFTGTTTGGLKVKSLTTAQRLAITPANGQIVYDSTLGENYQYIAGAWSAISAGSTQPNASTTVAGKVEIATTAESISGTDTGGTGALLSVLPSDIAKNQQSGTFSFGADAGGDDAYVVAVTPTLTALTTGMFVNFTATTANTGACTLDAGFGGALAIKTLGGNDPANGDVIVGLNRVQYNGTNWTLQRPTTASTAEPGLAEMATDAEAFTGTDQTRYINPSQLPKYGNGIITRSFAAASGAVTTAHGLGRVPKLGFFHAKFAQTGTSIASSDGSYNGTTNANSAILFDSNPGLNTSESDTTNAIAITWGVDNADSQKAVCTWDATNITLTWTKAGATTTGDIKITYELIA